MHRRLKELEDKLKPKEQMKMTKLERDELNKKLYKQLKSLEDRGELYDRLKPPYTKGTELEKQARFKLWEMLTDES